MCVEATAEVELEAEATEEAEVGSPEAGTVTSVPKGNAVQTRSATA